MFYSCTLEEESKIPLVENAAENIEHSTITTASLAANEENDGSKILIYSANMLDQISYIAMNTSIEPVPVYEKRCIWFLVSKIT